MENILKIFIDLNIQGTPIFGTWKWSENDYKKPLSFNIDNIGVKLFLKQPDRFSEKLSNLEVYHTMLLEMDFINPDKLLIGGLTKQGKHQVELAKKIYDIVRKVIYKFEVFLRTAGGVKNLVIEDEKLNFNRFFRTKKSSFDGSKVLWEFEGAQGEFIPKITSSSRKRHPLYKVEQLITVEKWKKIQIAIDNNNIPEKEIIELLKIQSRFLWRQKKIAVLESAILIETILREYSSEILKNRGFSNSKIKQVRDDLTFNSFLNVVLPLTLKKSQLEKLKESISSVDALRKVRNDLIHGEVKEDQVDEKIIEKGIQGGLKLLKSLREKDIK